VSREPRYNAGHGREAFATRVRMLRLHPEVWRQVPDGFTVADYWGSSARRQLWVAVVGFLRSCGLVAAGTSPLDVNVPKLIAAVRRLEAGRG
jgi:hypothetical protein